MVTSCILQWNWLSAEVQVLVLFSFSKKTSSIDAFLQQHTAAALKTFQVTNNYMQPHTANELR